MKLFRCTHFVWIKFQLQINWNTGNDNIAIDHLNKLLHHHPGEIPSKSLEILNSYKHKSSICTKKIEYSIQYLYCPIVVYVYVHVVILFDEKIEISFLKLSFFLIIPFELAFH